MTANYEAILKKQIELLNENKQLTTKKETLDQKHG